MQTNYLLFAFWHINLNLILIPEVGMGAVVAKRNLCLGGVASGLVLGRTFLFASDAIWTLMAALRSSLLNPVLFFYRVVHSESTPKLLCKMLTSYLTSRYHCVTFLCTILLIIESSNPQELRLAGCLPELVKSRGARWLEDRDVLLTPGVRSFILRLFG